MTDPSQDRITSLEQRLAKNPQSPLFAHLADCYLQAGRANDALRLCDDGLALFPYYATAHLVKAKVLTQLGMTAEARHAYEVVRELLPTNHSVRNLTAIAETNAPLEETAAAVVEEISEPPPAEPQAQDIAYQEIVVEEAVVESLQELPVAPVEEPAPPAEDQAPLETEAFEEPTPQPEEPPVMEALSAEPQPFAPTEPAQSADEGFGFGEQPAAEPQPEELSAAEKLGLDLQPEPQQDYSNFDFGAPPEQPTVVPVEENSFGTTPAEEIQQPAEPAQEPTRFEQPEVEEAPAQPEPTPEAAPAAEEQASDWFDAFSQLEQPAEDATAASAPAPTPTEEEDPFAVFGAESASSTVDAEPYEDFAARVRMEQFGTEDTMTLEEYLGKADSAEPPAAPADDIGDLAEKLKTSPRITPPVINFSEKAQRSASEPDAAGASGFVTPTLAEIYVKQGWFDDAIKAYRALAANKPAEREKFEQRIAEIEGMKK